MGLLNELKDTTGELEADREKKAKEILEVQEKLLVSKQAE